MRPEEFIETLRRERATAILRTGDAELARRAMDAAVRGGFRIIEFTLTIPKALDLIREFSARTGLIVGAGTVLSVEQAREAVAAGAKFLVSPITDEAVIKATDVAVLPGAFTPMEMMQAHRAGARLIKLFPAPIGPIYVRQILGPLPFLKIVPTAGVDASNAAGFLEAGAWAVGFTTSLFKKEDLAERRFDAVEKRAREFLAIVNAGAGTASAHGRPRPKARRRAAGKLR